MRTSIWSVSLALLLPLSMTTAAVAAEPPPLQPMDVFELEWADNPQVAPDGKSVIYQRQSFDKLKDRRQSTLWWHSLERDRQQPLATDVRGVAWSPKGDRLAWIASAEGGSEVIVYWLATGRSAVLMRSQSGVSDLAWSPDGTQLALLQFVPEQPPKWVSMPTAPKGAEWAPAAKVIETARYRADGRGYLEPGSRQPFVLPAEGGTPRRLTSGSVDHQGPLQWTADGSALIVSANRQPVEDPLDSELYRIALADGTVTALTDRDGPDQAPTLSPDGRWLAWLGFDDRGLASHQAVVHVRALAGGDTTVLLEDLDRGIDDIAWDAQGRGLYYSYVDQGVDHLAWIARDGRQRRVVAKDYGGTAMGRPYGGGNFHTAAGVLAYTRGDATRPADLAVVDGRGKSRQLTALNEDLLPHRRLGAVEERWFTSSADGRKIHGWLVKPPDFRSDQVYPLLLEIHGGPHADYGPRFAPETQLYAAAGYLVLYVNPRGSTGYGEEFTNLIQNAYPGQDFDDLMSAVDAVIAEGQVDPARLFVTGGSGGGVLTAWIVGHTERFRAAVVAKPVINWISFSLTADAYPFFTRYWFPALPWEQPEHYLQRSPLMHVGKVRTPTMLITGEDDHRTPISESEQYYQALQLVGVPTAMVRIPGASHGINARPSHMLTQVLHTIGWFQRFDVENAVTP
jgi:acylaminoacyl-peptidase